ncbi:MAG: hypothetical protein AB1757_12410 [Acidobacteriota bacterium]
MRHTFNTLLWALLLTAFAVITRAQTTTTANQPTAKKANGAAVSGISGGGIAGQLSKWVGFDGISFTLGNSIITEDKSGKIGIGTTTPTSPLTVQGMIETTLGGYKFPDGTVQKTALSAGQVVSSLNGLKGDVTLVAGTNIKITPNGNTLTIDAPNALGTVARDLTLTGDGTAANPLGIRLPLSLTAPSNNGAVIAVRAITGNNAAISVHGANNVGVGGNGIESSGGSSMASAGGKGFLVKGGAGIDGGVGIFVKGGDGLKQFGGDGLNAEGGIGRGEGNEGGIGVFAVGGLGLEGATDGLAGKFAGNVQVTGNLSKAGGSFKIDHPLDPENKYLYHSFVESPDMMNIYNGTITTDANGEATVTLPNWFEALNQDFRYQLTVIGTFAQAIVGEEIKDNRFVVKTNAPNVKVSWQVTGIRHDAYANKHRIPVEEQKPDNERGLLLHPDAFNQSAEKGVMFTKLAPQSERAKQQ